MVRPVSSILLRSALIGALAATTLLAGCGRKGPLELPPSAQVVEPGASPPPAMSPEGYPIAPPGERRPLPLDWLID